MTGQDPDFLKKKIMRPEAYFISLPPLFSGGQVVMLETFLIPDIFGNVTLNNVSFSNHYFLSLSRNGAAASVVSCVKFHSLFFSYFKVSHNA